MMFYRAVKKLLLIWTVAMLAAVSVQAESATPTYDEIVLKDGSRLIGTVMAAKDGLMTLKTNFAGTLSISIDQIVSVNRRNPVVVLLADDTVLRGTSLIINQENLVLPDSAQTYPIGDLQALNPEPWELGNGYRWTGAVSFALAIQRGNTDTDELDFKLHPVWRSKRDRYTVKWSGEKDETNGEESADNWRLVGKYDYFLTDPNYVGLIVSAEKDKFQDLDIRYFAGPYFGSQFYDKPIFALSGELGLSYVTEKYNIAEERQYWASNWNLHITSNYLGGKSALYFDQAGIWSLEDTSDIIVNSTFGLSFPLKWDLEAAAEMLFEYDSDAVETVEDLDQTYKVRIGYTW
ncbi:MAG: YdiY family protein [Halioglobus sp.]